LHWCRLHCLTSRKLDFPNRLVLHRRHDEDRESGARGTARWHCRRCPDAKRHPGKQGAKGSWGPRMTNKPKDSGRAADGSCCLCGTAAKDVKGQLIEGASGRVCRRCVERCSAFYRAKDAAKPPKVPLASVSAIVPSPIGTARTGVPRGSRCAVRPGWAPGRSVRMSFLTPRGSSKGITRQCESSCRGAKAPCGEAALCYAIGTTFLLEAV
jgi:hypothetical protein